MHELSIAQSVMEAVQEELGRRPGARLVKIGMRIGELAGVDPSSLRFGFECLARGTAMERAVLEIESCPRRLRCLCCQEAFAVEGFESACPRCGSPETAHAGGDELEVSYLELEQR